MTKREAYLAALAEVHASGVHDLRTVSALFPHMSAIDAVLLGLSHNGRIALPGAYVRGVVWVVSLRETDGLYHAYPLRSRESYVCGTPALHGRFDYDAVLPYNWQAAVAYADARWDEELVSDTYPSAVRFALYNIHNPEGSQTLRQATAFLTKPLGAIWNLNPSQQLAGLTDSLKHLTADAIKDAEIGGGEPEVLHYCWSCGKVLDSRGCGNCSPRKMTADNAVTGGDIPLPLAVIEAFESTGYRFQQDPRQWLTTP